jgi:magnesium-transporting ATPase (P-type)
VWLTKTRSVSIFEHGPLKNALTAYGVLAEVGIMVFFVYTPFLQSLFQTASLPAYWWATSFVTLLILGPYTEYSKKWTRENPEGWWARNMQW